LELSSITIRDDVAPDGSFLKEIFLINALSKSGSFKLAFIFCYASYAKRYKFSTVYKYIRGSLKTSDINSGSIVNGVETDAKDMFEWVERS
jgi:hypothetical protein